MFHSTQSARTLIAIVVAAFMTACNSGPVDTPHRSGPNLPFDAGRIVLELNQGWSVTGAGAGAYGDVYSFEAEPSLYQTSWHLKVASAIGSQVTNVAPAEVTAWVGQDLSKPSAGVRRLEALYLAIGALRGLKQPIPAEALSGIDALRTGEMYAWSPDQKPTWSATALADNALSAAGSTSRPGLAPVVLAALPAATSATGLTGWTEQLIPMWTLADAVLPEQARAPLRAGLTASLTNLRDAMASQSLSELTVFVMSQVSAIAMANHLDGLAVPLTKLEKLITPAGYLTTTDTDPTPSMVNTFDAIAMGYAGPGSPARQALSAYLQWSAAPKGWREDFTPPGPEASFYSWEVSQALGETAPRQPLSAQVKTWLNDAQDRTGLDLYFLVLLAQRLGMAIPPPLTEKIRGELQSDGTALKPGDLAVLARLSLLLGVAPGGAVSDLMRKQLSSGNTQLTRQLGNSFAEALALEDRTVISDLEAKAASAGAGPLWGSRPGAPAPDLQSTAIIASILGRTPAVSGAVQKTFADSRGYWLYAPQFTQGNVVDPRTLYFGLWLTGAPVDPGGVI